MAALRAIATADFGDLPCIVMESTRSREPEPGYLDTVREIATRAGAVLIFEEVSSCLRYNMGGIHLRYGVTPDVAVFAEAMGNLSDRGDHQGGTCDGGGPALIHQQHRLD